MKVLKSFRWLIVLVVALKAALAAGASLTEGQLTGTVLLAGQYERPPALRVLKSRSFCGLTVPNETLLVDGGGGVRNAVVLLTPADRAATVRPGRIVLDNKQCAFTPHVQVASLGSELKLTNSDPILHTVHARLGKETLFNVGLPRWRQVLKRLDRLGVVRIDCDVLHTWMSAAIVVVSTPYFAVTGEHGFFAIEGLPAGSYDVEIWHEKLGTKKARVAIAANTSMAVEIIYGGRPR